MKNRHFFSIVMALTFTVFFGACNKDNQVIDMDATIVTYGNSGSKVYVDGGMDGTHFAYWNNSDTVMINGNEYYLSVTTNSENQTIAAINGVAVNSGGYYAIYPCDGLFPLTMAVTLQYRCLRCRFMRQMVQTTLVTSLSKLLWQRIAQTAAAARLNLPIFAV